MIEYHLDQPEISYPPAIAKIVVEDRVSGPDLTLPADFFDTVLSMGIIQLRQEK